MPRPLSLPRPQPRPRPQKKKRPSSFFFVCFVHFLVVLLLCALFFFVCFFLVYLLVVDFSFPFTVEAVLLRHLHDRLLFFVFSFCFTCF